MKKVLKFLLIVFIWLVLLGICVAGSILLGYPENIGLKLFLIVFISWYGIKFLFFLYNRWQAKQRVEKLINIESVQSEKKRLSYLQFLFTKDVDKHIAKVIKRVTNSGTSFINDLTWVMHLKLDNQHSQWMKQSSVNKPKLSDPIFTEYKHLEWLVYNKFMMLDVDSYLMQAGNPSAKNEWLQLLNGLSYSSKKKSLDSLVVTISVNDLKDATSRTNIADTIRAKYEDIKEYCGVEVAVSIVLIGLEELNGVEMWLAHIAEQWQAQTLGTINKNKIAPTNLMDEYFCQLQQSFMQGSLKSLVNNGFDLEVANLPKNFQQIKSSVKAFTERFFFLSKFQTAPICAGFFIVMKKEANYAFVDSVLEGNALCWSSAYITNKATVSDVKKRKKFMAYMSASSVLAIMLLLLHSHDKGHISQTFSLYKKQISKSEDQASLVVNYQARYELIQNLSAINIGHWLVSTNDTFAIATLKSRLNKDIADQLIAPIDLNFEQKLLRVNDNNLDAKVDYLNVLMRRINILKAVSQSTSLSDLEKFPQPFDRAYIESMPTAMIDDINDIYLKSLVMTRSVDHNLAIKLWRNKIKDYRKKISEILLSSDGTMNWLSDWVNSNAGVEGITLKDYWKGSKTFDNAIAIKGVYTLAGKSAIDSFILQLTNALGNTHPFIVEYFPSYIQQYEKNYIASWGAFLKNFNQGQELLNNRNEWLDIINNLTNSRNIFLKVLNDADFQLSSFKDSIDKPDWFEFVLYYQDMLSLGEDEKQGNPKKNKVFTKLALKMVSALGPLGKSLSKSAKSGLKTKKKLDKAEGAGPGASERELNLQEASTVLDSYKTAIANLVFNIEQPKQSYTNIKSYFEFENNPAESATPLGNAKLTIMKLQSLVGKAGMSTAAFWNVYTGAISLLERFMIQETACYIDSGWKNDYLFELDGVPDYKLDTFAYGDTGVLWEFVANKLDPFLQKKRGGYSLKRVEDNKLPLKPALLNYLIRAKDLSHKQKYENFDLAVTAMPTDLNEGALLYVSETKVVLHCAAEDQVLVNNNYIVKANFKWQPSCTSVSLKINIGNKVIERFYGGENGVYNFLSDFRSGIKRFDLDEFPEYFYLLNQYKIKYLDVKLAIDGSLKLMNSLVNKPPKAPEKISLCWNNQ